MNGDDGGFVIVWMALMLLVLLAFCGFGIDVANWWFVGQKEQRAADAAALAGSVYLPNDFPTGRAQAIFVAAQNGYKNGVNATVTATQEPQPSRIRVTVTSTVTNFFAGLVGYNTETISRDAVADFQGPVPMGSPTSGLGQDPDEGDLQNFWLNTSGPGGTKREGDRFATKICNDSSVARCSGTTSLDYDPNSYLFRVRVGSIQAGQPLVIQVYDPAWVYTEDFCNNVQHADRPAAEQHPEPHRVAVEHHERRAERPGQHHPLRHERRRAEHQQQRHPLVHRRPERRRCLRQLAKHELHHPRSLT